MQNIIEEAMEEGLQPRAGCKEPAVQVVGWWGMKVPVKGVRLHHRIALSFSFDKKQSRQYDYMSLHSKLHTTPSPSRCCTRPWTSPRVHRLRLVHKWKWIFARRMVIQVDSNCLLFCFPKSDQCGDTPIPVAAQNSAAQLLAAGSRRLTPAGNH
ncbi:hypothetical protein EJ02DRAFT_266318 [Clathrospora elynae]|uniref:Uncharacterized protein n=1 Tax=Clathrospora elynae TaxID=706981 RepID=A0A6A5SGC1_9PLEO|nr:hypothetical protein EJ02DRAFT_266318 [Clathrospora elynae]